MPTADSGAAKIRALDGFLERGVNVRKDAVIGIDQIGMRIETGIEKGHDDTAPGKLRDKHGRDMVWAKAQSRRAHRRDRARVFRGGLNRRDDVGG